MPQDAFFLYHNTLELNKLLINGKINKINMPNSDEISLNIYTDTVYKLVISANAVRCRISLTDNDKDNPSSPYNFCMLLRKHLQGSQILKISLCGYERIVKIDFLCKNDFFENINKILYIEIMGKYSNVILTENNKILGALKTTPLDETAKRFLFCGAEYTLPPSQNKILITDKEKIVNLLKNENLENFSEIIFKNVMGISSQTASYMVNNYIKDNFNIIDFVDYLNDYFFNENYSLDLVTINGTLKDFNLRSNYNSFNCINDLQKAFYDIKETKETFEQKKKLLYDKIKNSIKKYEKKLDIISEKETFCNNIDENKIKGELLTSYIYLLHFGMEKCELDNYYSDNNKKITIALDKKLTPSQNAQAYFKKYNKQKKTLSAIMPQKNSIFEELNYLSNIEFELNSAEIFDDLNEIEKEIDVYFPKTLDNNLKKKNKNKGKENNPRTFLYENYTILAGKNNLQNDKILSDATGNDLWFHTKNYHSSHILIKSKNLNISNKTITIAAEICAFYSQGKNGDKIQVDYCLKKFVKKPPKSKPGFVIYNNFNSCFVTPNKHEELLIVN